MFTPHHTTTTTPPPHHHHRATVPQYNKLLDKIQAWWKVGIQCGATPEHTKQYWTIPNQTVVPSRWRKTKDVYQKNKLITIAYRLLWQVPGIVEHWHSVWGHTRPYQTISNLTKLNQTKPNRSQKSKTKPKTFSTKSSWSL
jgi:hypothetical protein